MALLDDLLAMYGKLQTASSNAVSQGNYADNARIIAAMTGLSNAIQLQEANDIIAALPNDATSQQVGAVIKQMNAIANAIGTTAKSITSIVEIVTGVTNIVVDVSSGNIADALTSVKGLVPVLKDVGVTV
jgi:hypothetical protein